MHFTRGPFFGIDSLRPEYEDRLMALALLLKWRPIEMLDRIPVDVRGMNHDENRHCLAESGTCETDSEKAESRGKQRPRVVLRA
jgi:hypothetical protein